MADPTTGYWAPEFVLRQRTIPDGLANALFLALPSASASASASASPSLRRAILLRRLSSDLSTRRISPHTLRLLELFQSLNPRPNPLASHAYLSVAAHLATSAPDFASAVSSLFSDRIGRILKSADASGLVSDRLKAVAEEMEKALTDPVLREEVVSRDTSKEAIEMVGLFLDKAWEEMELQPCFLQTAAQPAAQRKASCISKTIRTPTVKKLMEDLRSSCAELKETVQDPLPDAIKIANEVAKSLREKLGEEGTRLQVEMEMGAPPNCKGKDVTSTGGEGTSTALPKRSQIDRTPRACSFVCTETIESTSDDSEEISRRFHLATPKRIPVSPLRRVVKRKLGKRRIAKKWSVLEEDTLRKAVEEYGRGNWKEMLDHYRYIFDDRTEVDLKDKWRNMTR